MVSDQSGWLPEETALFTMGELLLILPLVLSILWGGLLAFPSHDIEESGEVVSYALYGNFAMAFKSSSASSFIFGIPFERMIPIHFWCGISLIISGCFHGAEEEVDRRGTRYVEEETGTIGTEPDLGDYLVEDLHNLSGTLMLSCLMRWV
jgi:hypothetical protein